MAKWFEEVKAKMEAMTPEEFLEVSRRAGIILFPWGEREREIEACLKQTDAAQQPASVTFGKLRDHVRYLLNALRVARVRNAELERVVEAARHVWQDRSYEGGWMEILGNALTELEKQKKEE